MKWSPYQEAIYSAIPQDFSFQVHAVAGSGKTTSLVESLKRSAAPRILALAFNKKIQLELEKRVPPHIQTKTLNGLGHRALMCGGKKLTLDTDKIFNIAKEIVKDGDLGEAMALARAARSQGLVPSNAPGSFLSLLPDTLESWEDLADYFDVDWYAGIQTHAREILLEAIRQTNRGLIDFDDQIYCVLFGTPFEQFDLVVVDESQDLSLVQHRMLQRSLAPHGRLIAFGDPHQAIYGFRGANAKSMALMEETFKMKVLPLSVSYRCPQAIVAEAKKIVPQIEPHPEAPLGEVRRWREWSAGDLPIPSAILCRNNAPLFELAMALLKQHIPCTVLGGDIGKGLMKLVHKLAPGTLPIDQFISKLEAWATGEISRKPRREGVVRDRTACLVALCSGVSTSAGLTGVLEKLFSGASAPIVLSSIHKAKGLEWNDVFILDSWRIPSKYATQPWQLEQEDNLLYVAITRAKQRLTYIDFNKLRRPS